LSAPAERAPAAIFVNEAAGSAASPRARRAIELTRRALDADLHATATRDPAVLRDWMEPLVDAYRTVVVAGGDGSLGVAYNVLAGRDITLGYLPAGFGNASAHLLHLPRDPAALAATVAAGDARPIDLVAVDGRLALFAGAGWDALVAGRYAAAGARGLAGWAVAIIRSVPDLWRRTAVEVSADGEIVFTGPMELLVVGTTPWYGRGMLVNPGARPDAGRLMLRVYSGAAPSFALEAARWVARVRPSARGVQAQEVVLRNTEGELIPVQGDGDLIGSAPEWRFVVRPAAVRLIGKW
jgi:diacylglycerol kinase (ATP)